MGKRAIAPSAILLDKYRVEEILGRGGMGVVVRARHISLDEVVAIKVMHDDTSANGEMCKRFVREARAAAKLRSKHVVRVRDVGKMPDGVPYMVMELLEGRDLGSVVKHGGPVAPSLAADLVIQVCEALAEAHALGIVHRDIKPSNLFVSADDDGAPHVKVLDFGIAKAPESVELSLTTTASMLGTPSYMSPEQLRSSRTVDTRTDIWSLGVVLFEILEGSRPFSAETFSALCLRIGIDPTPPLYRAPPGFASVVMRCLEKEPERRFQTAADLALALAPFAGDQDIARRELDRIWRVQRAETNVGSGVSSQPSAPSAAATTADGSVRRRFPWVIALTAAIVISGGIAAILALQKDGGRNESEPPAPIATPQPSPSSPTAGTVTPAAPPAAPPGLTPTAEAWPLATPSAPSAATAPAKLPDKRPVRPHRPGSTANAGSGSAKPPCDPFTSRTGC
jgi:eukaryotic-like serine/threonine-protein kinase